jgi:RES domain-containing protein
MTFKSSHAYSQFAQSVRAEWRYRLDPAQLEFLEELLVTGGSRIDHIPAGYVLCRAQEGCDWPESEAEEEVNPGPSGYGPTRMKPLSGRAMDGRVNPRGIPCLYTATDEETAAAETRAWVGAYVSIAQVKTNRDLRIINCTSEDKPGVSLFREPDPASWADRVWSAVDKAFAVPVERNDHIAEYAATQIVAETFRKAGYDGIAYRSALSKGYNIALFDVSVADVINCSVYEVKALSYKIEEIANRYFVAAHYS